MHLSRLLLTSLKCSYEQEDNGIFCDSQNFIISSLECDEERERVDTMNRCRLCTFTRGRNL